ncbi:putative serine/threonine-protein kinase PkwA [Gracilariopsis chorda]|uniref:Putative serine/threonine-protein kinase PkwA n=1 Tax=Gracilariopsis chorda TaxID=448386 RepID=A0A2V3IV64_9FLOR|nr:putative serine/threonine-protein kinase PkwA [Gracilariopsis chorda]|eukprot:PXF46011.1 putative serine/threonine-protein kinase PkwA [Gracilariopsis chorda]
MIAFIRLPLPSSSQASSRKKPPLTCSSKPPGQSSDCQDHGDSHPNEPSWELLQNRISTLREREVSRNRTIAHNWRTGKYRASIIASVSNDFVRKLAFRGDFMVLGTASGSVVFSDLVSGLRVCSPKVHAGQVTAIDYRDGYFATAGSVDKQVFVWPSPQYEKRSFWAKRVVRKMDVEGELPPPRLQIGGHGDYITSLQIHAETGRLYSASADGTVRVTQLDTGETLQVIRVGDPIYSMVLTKKGYLLLGCASGKVQAYQAEEGLYLLSIHCHTAHTTAIDYEEETELLATGDASGHLDIWSLRNSSHIASLNRHHAAVMSLQMDGAKIVTASRDGCVAVHPIDDVENSYAICGFTRYLGAVAFDETRLIADGTNDVIVCHRFDIDEQPSPKHLDGT